jgi:aminoglycoside phosphotransferase (APT) family kinase protein
VSEVEPALRAWIESATGGTVASIVQVTAGGRPGYAVDVERDGRTIELFLQKGRTGWNPGGSFLDVDREAEVLRALRPLGVPVPGVWAVDAERNVLLVDRMSGSGWF